MRNKSKSIDKNEKNDFSVWDNSNIKVSVLASIVIAIAVFLTGITGYTIARNEVIHKLKAQDLSYIASSIAAKIDGRINRAKETSVMFARDPSVTGWVESAEMNDALGTLVKQKLSSIVSDYDYQNSFIVSAVTKHYWDENAKNIDTMSTEDPDDSWFFNTISSNREVTVEIDYNNERKDTFVFIDALIGDENKPLGVAGVGLNLRDISKEFQSYKLSEKSNMWLVDNTGKIYLSEDIDHCGRNISEFLPKEINSKVVSGINKGESEPGVLEYDKSDGEGTFDLIYQPIKSADWRLVFQMPRKESLSIVHSIKINTIITCIITMLLIIIAFYFVSRKIANPFKRAVLLNQELEKKVSERTHELNEKNSRIMDSIEYAKLIQECILPSRKEIDSAFQENFIIWKPRDVVGGDFYFLRKVENGVIFILGDCTGHGVPGALMSMTVNSILNNIINDKNITNPAEILSLLNIELKQTLQVPNRENFVDDGLEAAVVHVSGDGGINFAGAGISLYHMCEQGLFEYKGDRKGIGYKKTLDDYSFLNNEIIPASESVFYITTDGFVDQGGGAKGFSLGKRRFRELINQYYRLPLCEQKKLFDSELHMYMGSEQQRDDITVSAFRPFV